MIDLTRLVDNACAAFDDTQAADFPLLVGKDSIGGNSQVTEIKSFPTVPTVPTTKQDYWDDNAELSSRNDDAGARARGEFTFSGGKSGNGGKSLQDQGVVLPTIDNLGGNRWEKTLAGRQPTAPRLSAGAARSGWDNLDDQPVISASPTVEGWRTAFYALHSAEPPCPGFRDRKWRDTFDATHAFLEQHAEAAHALGWTALDLFAVHRVVGATRVDCCGALMVSTGSLVSAVEQDVIAFQRGRFFRRPHTPEMVLVWSIAR